jgi:hypothetical protein
VFDCWKPSSQVYLPRFNSILKQSIRQEIESVADSNTAKSIEFYLDSSIAGRDIAPYTRALEKMFDVGTKLIEDKYAESSIQEPEICELSEEGKIYTYRLRNRSEANMAFGGIKPV